MFNVLQKETGELMLLEDVSYGQAIRWYRYYTDYYGRPYPNGKGYYFNRYMIVPSRLPGD